MLWTSFTSMSLRESISMSSHISSAVVRPLKDVVPRIFTLPSKAEHWGLVVHEAALSGCALALSDRVGAAADLLTEGVNGCAFDPENTAAFAAALRRLMTMDDGSLAAAHDESLRRAAAFGPDRFAEGFLQLLGKE